MKTTRYLVRTWLGFAIAAFVVGCASQENVRDAISAINAAFQKEYEETLAKNGTHVVHASPREAFDAVTASLVKVGLVVHEQSRDLGVISAEAPAPLPLTKGEFDKCAAIDLPRTREIIRPYLSGLADLFNFDVNGLDTVITATIIGVPAGAEISFTMRMREVGPPKTNFPRRDYPPPNALRCGLDKLWDGVNRDLATLPSRR